jgi:hypothetical protein
MLKATSILGIIGLLAAVSVPASAQGKGKSSKPEARTSAASAPSITVVFRDSDQATFREYFRTNRITATALPPGIAKNVARGKPLPPGIAKRAVPSALLAQGPKVDRDITFTIAGDVVVAMRRDVVVDILRNIF